MTDELFQPDCTCPNCGRQPRLGLTREFLAKWANDAPGVVVQTYMCEFERYPGKKCNTVFRITVGDLHRARPFRNPIGATKA